MKSQGSHFSGDTKLHVFLRTLYRIMIYRLYQYFGYTIHIVSFILVIRYFKQYIFA